MCIMCCLMNSAIECSIARQGCRSGKFLELLMQMQGLFVASMNTNLVSTILTNSGIVCEGGACLQQLLMLSINLPARCTLYVSTSCRLHVGIICKLVKYKMNSIGNPLCIPSRIYRNLLRQLRLL